jgi:hypothetical protein
MMKYGNRRSAHIEKLCATTPSQTSSTEAEKTDKDNGSEEQ